MLALALLCFGVSSLFLSPYLLGNGSREVEASTGVLKAEGYYDIDGVNFYAVKVTQEMSVLPEEALVKVLGGTKVTIKDDFLAAGSIANEGSKIGGAIVVGANRTITINTPLQEGDFLSVGSRVAAGSHFGNTNITANQTVFSSSAPYRKSFLAKGSVISGPEPAKDAFGKINEGEIIEGGTQLAVGSVINGKVVGAVNGLKYQTDFVDITADVTLSNCYGKIPIGSFLAKGSVVVNVNDSGGRSLLSINEEQGLVVSSNNYEVYNAGLGGEPVKFAAGSRISMLAGTHGITIGSSTGPAYLFEATPATGLYTSYFPSYKVVMQADGVTPFYVRNGDTVLLAENEKLFLALGRQIPLQNDVGNASLDTIRNNLRKAADYPLYADPISNTSRSLTLNFMGSSVNLTADSVSVMDKTNGSQSLAIFGINQQQFGYLFDLRGETKVNPDSEGAIKFQVEYAASNQMIGNFEFNFHLFKQETYVSRDRASGRDDGKNGGAGRRAPAIELEGELKSSVAYDPAFRNLYYNEMFAYYEDSTGKLPSFIYDHKRYELNIVKTIASTVTTYPLAYDAALGRTKQTIEYGSSTAAVYAREIPMQQLWLQNWQSISSGEDIPRVVMSLASENGRMVYRDAGGNELIEEIFTGNNQIVANNTTSYRILRSFKTRDSGAVVISEYQKTVTENGKEITHTFFSSFARDQISAGLDLEDQSLFGNYLARNNYTRIMLKDIGEYRVGYRAVYYTISGTRHVLTHFNSTTLQDRITVAGVQLTYNDAQQGRLEMRDAANVKKADVTQSLGRDIQVSGTAGTLSEIKFSSRSIYETMASSNQPPLSFFSNASMTSADWRVYRLSDDEKEREVSATPAGLQIDTSAKEIRFNDGSPTIEIDRARIDFSFGGKTYVYYSADHTDASKKGKLFECYYELTNANSGTYSLNMSTFSSPITRGGYYFAEFEWKYAGNKQGVDNAVSNPKNGKQYFMFCINNSTPRLNIFRLDSNGNADMSAAIMGSGNTYLKDGVFIQNGAMGGSFDSFTRMRIYRKEYNGSYNTTTDKDTDGKYKADGRTIEILDNRTNSNNAVISNVALSATNARTLFSGVTKNANYWVVLEYGTYRSSSDTFTNQAEAYFTMDNSAITGVHAQNVAQMSGTDYFMRMGGASTPEYYFSSFDATALPFVMGWSPKESKANIRVSYQLFPLQTAGIPADRVAETDWVRVNSRIDISSQTSLPYTAAGEQIRSNNVLSTAGLYIFQLLDEAGNVNYFSIVLERTSPKVLQRTRDMGFDTLSAFNLISFDKEIYYGTHKVIPFYFGGDVAGYMQNASPQNLLTKILGQSGEVLNSGNPTGYAPRTGKGNLQYAAAGDTGILYLTVPIRRVDKQQGGKAKTTLFNTAQQNNKYDTLKVNSLTNSGQATSDVIEESVFYHVYDTTNVSDTAPSTIFTAQISSDLSGAVFSSSDAKGNVRIMDIAGTDTSPFGIENRSRTIYYNAAPGGTSYEFSVLDVIPFDVQMLPPTIEWYPLVYDNNNRTYNYAATPTAIPLSGYRLEGDRRFYPIPGTGITQDGKYVITREYASSAGIGRDYVRRSFVIFVDSESMITIPTGADQKMNGAYTGMILFKDVYGQNMQSQEITFTEFYRQTGQISRPVFQTNKIPAGIYLPFAKYGTIERLYHDEYGNEIIVSDDHKFTETNTTNKKNAEGGNIDYTSEMVFQVEKDDLANRSKFYPFYTYFKVSYNGYITDTWVQTPNSNNYLDFKTLYNLNFYNIERKRISGSAFLNADGELTGAGVYTIWYGSVQDKLAIGTDSEITQKFYFTFEILDTSPEFKLEANYNRANLPYMNETILESYSNGNYYTNADTLRVSFTDPSTIYTMRIDVTNIRINNTVFNINTNSIYMNDVRWTAGMDRPLGAKWYFALSLGNFSEGQSFDIRMVYEGLTQGTAPAWTSTTKTVIIDRTAPIAGWKKMKDNDNLVSSFTDSSSELRIIQSRINISSKTSERFRYYSYVVDIAAFGASGFQGFRDLFLPKEPTNTQTAYIRKIGDDKYGSSQNLESVLPLDPESASGGGTNLFNPSLSTWKNMRDFTDFSFYQYYEIVEMDLAGNMTIYSVYLVSREGTFDISLFTSYTTRRVSDSIVSTTQVNNLNNYSDGYSVSVPSRQEFILNDIAYGKTDYNLTIQGKLDRTQEGAPSFSWNLEPLNYHYQWVTVGTSPARYFYKTPFTGGLWQETNRDGTSRIGSPVALSSMTLGVTGRIVDYTVRNYLFNKTAYLSVNVVQNSESLAMEEFKAITVSGAAKDVIGTRLRYGTSSVGSSGVRLASQIELLQAMQENNTAFSLPEMPNYDFPYTKVARTVGGVTADEYIGIGIWVYDPAKPEKERYNFALPIVEVTTSTQTSYYVDLTANPGYRNSVFVVRAMDNFGRTYTEFTTFNTPNVDKFSGPDVTAEMQNSSFIVSSDEVRVNVTNLYTVTFRYRYVLGNVTQFLDAGNRVKSYVMSGYTQYILTPEPNQIASGGFYGNIIEYEVTRKSIHNANAWETTIVRINNYMPQLVARDTQGKDVSNILSTTTTVSGMVTGSVILSFNSLFGEVYVAQARIIKLGTQENWQTLISGMRIDNVGNYQVQISLVHSSTGASLSYKMNYYFAISETSIHDYAVVKRGETNFLESVGTFRYGTNSVATYHYIVTGEYDIIVNPNLFIEARNLDSIDSTTTQAVILTDIWEITNYGVASTDRYFRQIIAITRISQTNNLFGGAPLFYSLGAETGSKDFDTTDPSSQRIFFGESENANSVTVWFSPYYGVENNVIRVQASKDEGDFEEYNLVYRRAKDGRILYAGVELQISGRYRLRFVDRAGNYQTFATSAGSSGAKTDLFTLLFVKSVIFHMNGGTPVDNGVFNQAVSLSIPAYTVYTNNQMFYDNAAVTLHATKDGLPITITRQSGSSIVYLINSPGTYQIWFSATYGGMALKQEVYTFQIIKPENARWAFDYQNYRSYTIDGVWVNGQRLTWEDPENPILSFSMLRSERKENGSVVVNNPFNPDYCAPIGEYRVRITTGTVPSVVFEFVFQLSRIGLQDGPIPPIEVLQGGKAAQEGTSTTGTYIVHFNARSILDTLGNSVVQIRRVGTSETAAPYAQQNITRDIVEKLPSHFVDLEIRGTGGYFVQLYSESGNLIYSFRVNIHEPLNTMSIILIVGGCVLFVGGAILFILLRKRMKIR